MRETVIQLLHNEKSHWSGRKPVITRCREHEVSLAEQMHSRIHSGDHFFSIEISPPKYGPDTCQLLRSLHNLYDVCNPLFTAVTWHLGLRPDTSMPAGLVLDKPQALSLATAIGNTNSVLLHLSSVGLTKRQVLQLLCCASDRGIRNIFALRGDIPAKSNVFKLRSGFPYATDLVSFIQEKFHDHFTICVAGYPLGHPDAVCFEQDLVYLKEKTLESCIKVPLEALQSEDGITFDTDPQVQPNKIFLSNQSYDFVNFVQQCRRIGITVPIIPGIMIIQNYASLIHISNFCGVEVSREVLDVIKPIKDNEEAVRKFGIHLAVQMVSHIFLNNYSNGVHFFTLNRQLSIIETCKYLGFCLPEPMRPLQHHETRKQPHLL